MTEKDFQNLKTFKFFNEVLNVELIKYHFELIPNSIEKSHELLYILEYKRQFTDYNNRLNYYFITINAIPAKEDLLTIFGFCDNKKIINSNIECNFNEKKKILSNFENKFIIPFINLCSIQLIDLPIEVKIEILKNLRVKSLINLSKTSKYWYNFIKNEDIIWKNLFLKDFGVKCNVDTIKNPGSSWKKTYIEKSNQLNINKKMKLSYSEFIKSLNPIQF